MTPAERAMWAILREHFPQRRFRKQVPLLHYIVDFASHRARLVIEIDGGQHGGPEDAARDAALAGEGYRVVRYWNNEVLENGVGVAEVLQAHLA
jgi:very-short-patch-repair endonuclease